MTSILEFQRVSIRNKSIEMIIDIQKMIVESCTIEQIAENEYLSEAMK